MKMPQAKQLTDSERDQIKLLRRLHPDWTQTKIAESVGRSRSVVSRFLASPETYGKGIRSGRPKVTTAREDRAIVNLAERDKKSCEEIRTDLDLEASVSTINRRLRENPNIRYGRHKAKPVLQQHHKKNRLDFATKMVSVSRSYWDSIIFSDEKKFNLDGPDGLRCFWYDLRKEKTFFSKRHSGGGGVMVWAGFSTAGTTEIAFCKPKMNSTDYQDLLGEYLLPVGPLITNGSYVFQQDNAPIHRSASTKLWLEANGVTTFDWPALSPDLNPIENLWGWLSRKVYAHGRQFTSIASLKEAIVESWAEVTPELRESLISSMKNRMIKVIQAHGGSINY